MIDVDFQAIFVKHPQQGYLNKDSCQKLGGNTLH